MGSARPPEIAVCSTRRASIQNPVRFGPLGADVSVLSTTGPAFAAPRPHRAQGSTTSPGCLGGALGRRSGLGRGARGGGSRAEAVGSLRGAEASGADVAAGRAGGGGSETAVGADTGGGGAL